MFGQASNNLEVVEEARVGVKARVCIWGLAFLVYGGGMALWFVSMPVVKPAVEGSLSFLYLFASHDSEPSAAHSDEASPPLEDEDSNEEPDAIPPEEVTPEANPVVEARPEPIPEAVENSTQAPAVRSSSPWPSIKVVGVMTKQGKRAVMLGTDIVPAAGSTRGITVEQIDGENVLLVFEGEKKWVHVGDLTDRETR